MIKYFYTVYCTYIGRIFMKKLICIDLDGVLNTYCGNYEENEIPSLREGAFEFLANLSKEYRIVIFTTRSRNSAKNWLVRNNLMQFITDVTDVKPRFASIILDDRALNFDGNFNKAYEKILKFKPHWKS